MNDLLPPPLFNVNRPSHSEIQLFQNLTMKILGQSHVCGQRSRSHLTLKIQRSRSWPRSNPLVTFEAWSSIDLLFLSWQWDHFWSRYSKFNIWPWKVKVKVKVMATVKPDGHIWSLKFNWYVCFSFHEILLRYSKFHIWLWKLKVKVTTKIDQNLVSWFLARCQQSCQKWKKSKKSLKSYHMNKTLLPAVYEPVQNIKSPPVYLMTEKVQTTLTVTLSSFVNFVCWSLLMTFSVEGFQGPARPNSLTIFHHNSNVMEILFRSHANSIQPITIILWTWHDSCAVVTCAEICGDTYKWISHQIWIVMENVVSGVVQSQYWKMIKNVKFPSTISHI